jgi:hypothetical protein
VELPECADLLGQLLPVSDDVLARGKGVQGRLDELLVGDQPVDAVQGHASVVPDDAATTVGVGQTSDDV